MTYRKQSSQITKKKNHYKKMIDYLDEKQSEYENLYKNVFKDKNGEKQHLQNNKNKQHLQEIQDIIKSFDAIYNKLIVENEEVEDNLKITPNQAVIYPPIRSVSNMINSSKELNTPFFNLSPPFTSQETTYPNYHKQQNIYNFQRRKVNIQKEIENIDDILYLIDKYPISYDVEYNINMESLHKIKQPLIELNSMIGMTTLKSAIVDQIIYFIQGLQSTEGDFMHSCIYGPPGTGKTEIAKVMGKIFSNLGILKKSSFKKVTRSDLVAGYLGQTAIKTRDVIKDSLGGVLFIDEAYALGNPEKRDSFAKECIDTLCEALSDHKDNLMVIIAGYEDELNRCFFSFNQGLNSRFTWRFKTDDYNYKELRKIFLKKIDDAKWSVCDAENDVSELWFKENMGYFKYFGRDMETLFSKVKIAHSRRVFCLDEDKKRVINKSDLEKGFTMYLENDEVKKRKDNEIPYYARAMYN